MKIGKRLSASGLFFLSQDGGIASWIHGTSELGKILGIF